MPAAPLAAAPSSLPARSAGRTGSHLAAPRFKGRQTLLRSIAAEWVKIWTLRSTWITSLVTIAVTVLVSVGLTAAVKQSSDAASAGLYITQGNVFGQLVVAVLAALIVTGEYSSGQIRSSLAAVPRRGRILLGKAVVISAVSFLLGSLSALASWAISKPLIGEHARSLGDSHYFGLIWGSGLSYVGIALLTLGVGFLLRSTAGSITVAVTLLFVLNIPLGLMSMKWDWAGKLQGLLPGNLANAVSDPFQLSTTWGAEATSNLTFLEHTHAVLAFSAWALVPLVLAWIVFSRRDA